MNNYSAPTSSLPPTDLASALPGSGVTSRTIAVTGGQGIGKTHFVANVALELALRRRGITVVNIENGSVTSNTLLEAGPTYNLSHVLIGACQLNEIMTTTPQGIRLISASRGMSEFGLIGTTHQVLTELEQVEQNSFFTLIDTPAGCNEQTLRVLGAASEVVLLTAPDPPAIVEAYGMIKAIHRHSPTKLIWIVVNSILSIRDGEEIFRQLNSSAVRFLNHPLEYLGAIPDDEFLAKAADAQKPVVWYAPGRPASRSFRVIASQLFAARHPSLIQASSFWKSLV